MNQKTENKKQKTKNTHETICSLFSVLCFSARRASGASRGFTLVEMIVSVFIFSIVMLIATGALVSIVEANRKAQSVKSVMNNLNFALDSMTRAIRVGTAYDCGVSSCDPDQGTEEFNFLSTDGEEIHYRFNKTDMSLERSTDGGINYLALTAPEVDIEVLKFYVRGERSTDNEQPRVLLVFQGFAGPEGKTRTVFSLQTLITQRLLDR
ncbi:MAG: type II secretion system protein [Patescibacteria group bacterium]